MSRQQKFTFHLISLNKIWQLARTFSPRGTFYMFYTFIFVFQVILNKDLCNLNKIVHFQCRH